MCKDIRIELDSDKLLLTPRFDYALDDLNFKVGRIALNAPEQYWLRKC